MCTLGYSADTWLCQCLGMDQLFSSTKKNKSTSDKFKEDHIYIFQWIPIIWKPNNLAGTLLPAFKRAGARLLLLWYSEIGFCHSPSFLWKFDDNCRGHLIYCYIFPSPWPCLFFFFFELDSITGSWVYAGDCKAHLPSIRPVPLFIITQSFSPGARTTLLPAPRCCPQSLQSLLPQSPQPSFPSLFTLWTTLARRTLEISWITHAIRF